MDSEAIQLTALDAVFGDKAVTTIIATKVSLLRDNPAPFRFVGIVQVQHRELRCARFMKLFVEPDHRRQGIARKLVAACEQVATSTQCESIGLLVEHKNLRAQAIYERLGYIMAYEDETGYIMAKQLPAR